MAGSKPRIAVVLSGGGSRGAYEAGVLLFIRERLGKLLGRPAAFDIITGTSVGAINASFVAATLEEPEKQGRALCDLWRSLRLEQLIALSPRDILNAGRLLLGAEPPPPSPNAYRYGGVLNTSGLESFVIQHIPWRGIRHNLAARRFHALSLSATQVGSGMTMVFIDSCEPIPEAWSRNPFSRHRAAMIGPRHALASAAIPMLFPAVRVGKSFYVDGGLRQNTPMSPAIRLGADRILVISLRHQGEMAKGSPLAHSREVAYPKPLFLAGKALNALLLDHTDYDIERMERLNAILEAGEAAFGAEFESVVNRELIKLRGAPIRRIEAAHIRPSKDIGEIASDFVAEGRIAVEGAVAKRLVGRLARSEASHESDLLSYLLFDGNYSQALIDLGYHDAALQEDQLAELFRPT